MNKKDKLKSLKRKQTISKLERNLYLISAILFFIIIIINISNIYYNPYIINFLILIINISIIIFISYLTIKKQKYLLKLEDETLEFKIKYILNPH